MNVVQVDPDKKYVLVMPDATAAQQVERILVSLRAFMEADRHVIFAVYGVNVIIVPADQVVGYKALDGVS